jgi:hypothetical protein
VGGFAGEYVMANRFKQTITGGSQNTGRAVVRIGAGATAADRASLSLPTNWTADDEGRKLLNERLRQIEYELGRPKDYEVSVPVHYAYADWDSATSTGFAVTDASTPVTGAKLSLDKIGTWLLLVSTNWHIHDNVVMTAYLAVDPETEAAAKVQAATIEFLGVTTDSTTKTGWCLFTVTAIPRLVQLYAKKASGAGATMLVPPTHIAAIWLSSWAASTRRFGRQTPSLTTSILDPYGDPLTIYGEEARWPASENPDNLPIGADFVTL